MTTNTISSLPVMDVYNIPGLSGNISKPIIENKEPEIPQLTYSQLMNPNAKNNISNVTINAQNNKPVPIRLPDINSAPELIRSSRLKIVDGPIQKIIPPYKPDDPYTIFDFIHEFNGKIYSGADEFEALNIARIDMLPKMARVIRYVAGNQCYYAKTSINTPVTEIKIDKFGNIGNGYYFTILFSNDKGKVKTVRKYLFYLLLGETQLMSQRIDCIPYHTEEESITDPKVMNTFPGFKAKMIPGMTFEQAYTKCFPLLKHIHEVWAGSVLIYYNYIMEALATPIRDLTKTDIMLILTGPQGAGKSVVFEFLEAWVTGKGVSTTVTLLDHIVGHFNPLILNKMYVCINEANKMGNKEITIGEVTEKMKSFITDSHIAVNDKNTKIINMENICSFFLTTNNEQPMYVTPGDRRYAIFKCLGLYVKNFEYFKKLIDTIMNQEFGDAFYTLLRLMPKLCNLKEIPETEARIVAIQESKTQGSGFFNDLMSGNIPISMDHVHILDILYLALPELYQYYVKWHDRTNNGKRWSQTTFSREIKKEDTIFVYHPDKRLSKTLRTTAYSFKTTEHFPTIRLFTQSTLGEPVYITLKDKLEQLIAAGKKLFPNGR